MEISEGRKRVVIENVKPELNQGRFSIKRAAGEKVTVEADIFADGQDSVAGELLFRRGSQSDWQSCPLTFLGNDRWRGEFTVEEIGTYFYTLRAWVDHFRTWCHGMIKKANAGHDVETEFPIGVGLLEEAGERARGVERKSLLNWTDQLKSNMSLEEKTLLVLDARVEELAARYPDTRLVVEYGKDLPVVADRKKAGFSAWYEMFPRSCSRKPEKHGNFKDCESWLPYISNMGFDVLYLPPVHPIGRTYRKGKNNSPAAGPGDPGSPWATGAREGGHKSVHPELGTLEDFRNLVKKAGDYDIEIAMDLAFNCTPDHPYVKEHPEWFRHRPDGSIQHAENPPKKYQDIYPFDFETEHWRELWHELKSIVDFWIDQGIRIFRMDNPHTKPFCFWEWLIHETKEAYPEVIFLSEAFTRPKVMYRLAKLGFTQSYTYFAWRNTSREIRCYFEELMETEALEFFRPNLWPNTPDILPEYLQMGKRPAFMVRLILAATIGGNYGIYGPAFELCENRAKEPGSEEYLNSEKYEIKDWDINNPESLKELISRVNRIRRENPAFQSTRNLRFLHSDNENLLSFTRHTDDFSNIILVVVNLDPHHVHSGWITIPLEEMGLKPEAGFQVHDLLSDSRYLWNRSRNYVEINPHIVPAHIFRIRRRIRTERDFDYFM